VSIEYDPNRNANISLIQYEDGENVIFYIQKLVSDLLSEIKVGNALAFKRYSIRDRCSQFSQGKEGNLFVQLN
jgi:ribosomal protein L2